jgi:hypothetical protein
MPSGRRFSLISDTARDSTSRTRGRCLFDIGGADRDFSSPESLGNNERQRNGHKETLAHVASASARVHTERLRRLM